MNNRNKIYNKKLTLTVYIILRVLVVFSMISCIVKGNYEGVLLCILTLVLMIVPSLLKKQLKVDFPQTLEVIILCFIFASEILGEINSFYVRVPHWDTVLHTLNGFLCAAVGFAMLDLFNRHERLSFCLNPYYLALMAFCFSMTIGVLWEFTEYSCDKFFGFDMQKDTIVSEIHSVALSDTKNNKVIKVSDIDDVIIVHSDGSTESLGVSGYIDIGLHDTMKDLIVNFIGAAVFSIIGYFYQKKHGDDAFAAMFIPTITNKKE